MGCPFWWSDLVRFELPFVSDFEAITVSLDKSSDHIQYVLPCDFAGGYPKSGEYLMDRKERDMNSSSFERLFMLSLGRNFREPVTHCHIHQYS
jgi:hypothetical protein